MKIISIIDGDNKNYMGFTDNENVVSVIAEISYLTNRECDVREVKLEDLTTIKKISNYDLFFPRNHWSIYQVSANINTKDGWKLEHKIDILHSSYNETIVKMHVYEHIIKEFSSIINEEGIDIEVVEQKLNNLDTTLKGYVVENN